MPTGLGLEREAGAASSGPMSPEDPRRPLLDMLEAHRAVETLEAVERTSTERMIAFVKTCPRCFERAETRGHVTGSAWVVDHAGERVVLLHHRKLGRWLQPGGHADGDPDVARVAAKEAEEETGIQGLVQVGDRPFDVDVHAIPARPHEGGHFHFDVRFLFRAPEGARLVLSDESHELRWVARADVPKFTTEESVLRLLRKWRRGDVGAAI